MLSSTGWARIGETLEQCIARYGEPVGEPERVEGVPEALTYMFLKGGISRFVTIWRSKAADIMFINQMNDRFSSTEVEKLLADNSGSGAWGRGIDGATARMWITHNGEMEAIQLRSPTRSSLSIYLSEFARARNREEQPASRVYPLERKKAVEQQRPTTIETEEDFEKHPDTLFMGWDKNGNTVNGTHTGNGNYFMGWDENGNTINRRASPTGKDNYFMGWDEDGNVIMGR